MRKVLIFFSFLSLFLPSSSFNLLSLCFLKKERMKRWLPSMKGQRNRRRLPTRLERLFYIHLSGNATPFPAPLFVFASDEEPDGSNLQNFQALDINKCRVTVYLPVFFFPQAYKLIGDCLGGLAKWKLELLVDSPDK